MTTRKRLRDLIFKTTEDSFEEMALRVFHYQYESNEVYHQFCSLLNVGPSLVQSTEQIPFLPIEVFKTHSVVTGDRPVEKIFTSSGTTGQQVSRHQVCDLTLYEESFLRCFDLFFGSPEKFCILALLPSYLEREDSSLVYMTNHLIEKSSHRQSGFFLYNHDKLKSTLLALEQQQQNTLLIGVSFGLLDFAEKFPLRLNHVMVMETGGMKGRRKEIIREAMHEILKREFSVSFIYSEYGMTELLSQAYLLDDGKFHGPPWMKILIRDVNDPLQILGNNQAGGINIIDLANLDSCAFIASADIGKRENDGSFEVSGRMDYSDIRGCNLLWE